MVKSLKKRRERQRNYWWLQAALKEGESAIIAEWGVLTINTKIEQKGRKENHAGTWKVKGRQTNSWG